MMTNRVPATCREAAEMMREMADRAVFDEESQRCIARAEILEAFEDAPVPASIIEEYIWPR